MFYFLLCRFVAATTMQLEWLWWLSLPFSVVAGWGVSIQYSVVGIQPGGYSLYKEHSRHRWAAVALLWLPLPSYSLSHKLPNTRTRQLFQSWELDFRSSAIQESSKWVNSYLKKASAKTCMKSILCGEQCCNRVTPPLSQVIGLPPASDYCWLLLI